MARKPGLLTSGEIDAVRLVGPSAPVTKRRLPSSFSACAAASRASLVELVGDLLHAIVGLRDRRRGEGVGRNDIGAGTEVLEMDVADRVRAAEIQEIVIAAHLAVPGVETRAAITLLIELELLDYRPHGAIEHQDALLDKFPERGAGVGAGRCHDTWTPIRRLVRPPAVNRAGGRWHRRGRRGSSCRSGNWSRPDQPDRGPAPRPPQPRS